MPVPFRRLLVVAAASVVLLPALVLVALHLPWVQRALVTRVLDGLRTSAGLDISVRRVRLSPTSLALTAEGVRVAAVGHDAHPLLEVHQLELDLARVVLTSRGREVAIERLVLDEPVVALRRDASGAWNLPPSDPAAAETALPRIFLDGLEIRGGRVLVDDGVTDASLHLTALAVTTDGRAPRVGAPTFDARAQVDARVVDARAVGTLGGGLQFDGRVLTLRSVALHTGASSVVVDGTVDIDSTGVALNASLDIDAADAAPFAGTPGLRGNLQGTVTLAGTPDAPEATWSLRGEDLTDGTLPVVSFTAQGAADTTAVGIDTLTGGFGGGAVVLEGTVGLTKGSPTRLAGRVRGLRLHDLTRAYAPAVPVVSLVDATLAAQGDALDWNHWRSSVAAQLRIPGGASRPGEWPVDGVASATIDDGRWNLDANIASPDVVVMAAQLGGRVGTPIADSTVAGTVYLAVDDLVTAAARVTGAPVDIAGRASLDARLSGTFAAPRAAWAADGTASTSLVVPIVALAEGTGSLSELTVASLTVTSGPNEVTGDAVVGLAAPNRLAGTFRGALPALGRLLHDETPLGWPLAGGADIAGSVAGTLDVPVVQADVSLRDMSFAGQTVDRATAALNLTGSRLRVEPFVASSGIGRASGAVTFDLGDGTHGARFAVTNWPVQGLPATTGDPARAAVPLTAALDADIDTRGPLDQPEGTIAADLTHVSWEGHAASAVRLRGTSTGQHLDVTFEAPDVQTTGSGRVVLRQAYPFDFTVTTDGLSLEPFRPWLPETLARASGEVSSLVRLEGEASDPVSTTNASVHLQRFAFAMDDARVALEAPSTISVTHRDVRVDDFALRTGDLVARVDGAFGHIATDDALEVTASGTLQSLAPWLAAFELPSADMAGVVDLRASVSGTLDAPRPAATLRVTDVVITERPQVTVRVPQLTAVLDDGLVTLEPMTAEWDDARLTASGRLPLRLLDSLVGDDGRVWLGDASGLATLSVATTALHTRLLEPYVGRAALEGVSGHVAARLEAEASTATWKGVSGLLTLDEAAFTLAGLPLAQARPTVLRLADGELVARDVLFSGPNTDLAVDGAADLTAGSPTFDVQLRGLTDLAILRPFLADAGAVIGGRTEINLRAVGSVDAPRLTGELLLTDASLRLAEPRLAAELLNGTATFTGRQMAMPALTGFANGAPVNVSIALALSPDNAVGGQLRVRASGLPLEYPEGMRTESDLDVLASIAGPRIDVTGTVDVLRGIYREPIALSALSSGLLTASAVDAGEATSAFDVRFDVQVRTREDLLVDNNYGRFSAGGAVRVIGTLDEPALSGRITVGEGGELYLGGLTYRVERGAVDFANPSRIEPIVDLAAETRARGERIRIEASGTPDTLEVALSAPDADVPPSQAELASLLVSGRSLDDLSGLAAGEQALGLLSADLLGVVGRGVGLDALRLDRDLLIDDRVSTGEVDIAAETDPVARLTLAKRLRSNVEVVFSQNLRDASQITWLVTWTPLRRTELRLLQRDDRSTSYEFRRETGFGVPPAPPRVRTAPTRVRSVDLTVADGDMRQALVGRLRLGPGDRFDFYRWQDDRDRLESWLLDQRYYEHRVVARRVPVDDADGPVVDLRYEVTSGPRARLEVEGAALDASVLARMRDAWYGSVFDGFLQDDLSRLAREAMLAIGHPLATASVSVTSDGREKVALVTIAPGQPLGRRLDTPDLEGALASRFHDWLSAGAGRQAWLDSSAFETSATTWLRNRGLLDAEVSLSAPDVREAEVVRTVRVADATAYRLGPVQTTGVPDVRQRVVRDELGLTSGESYDALDVGLARRDLERWYIAEGFGDVDVSVTTTVRHADTAVDVQVAVKEGARAIIVESRVEGGRTTQQALLDRALALPLGAVATPEQLLAARKRLYDTGVLAAADVEATPTGPVTQAADGTLEQPVLVTGAVRELPRLRLRYGLAINDDVLQDSAFRATSSRRVTPGLSALLENRNLFGRAVVGGMSARYERARQTGRAFVTSPWLFGRDVRLQASSGLTRSRLIPDLADSPIDVRTDATIGATQRLPGLEGLRLTYGYRYERSRTYDPNAPDLFDITITAPRLTSTVFIDRRDDAADATRGWFHASTIEVSRGWVGSDFEFAKYYGQQSVYQRLGRAVLAGRAQVGVGRGFGGQDLIGSERFFAGGAVSVRGYGESAIGELDPILGIARGDGLVVLNGEVRMPLWRWISGVGFVDGGGVFARVSDISLPGVRWGTGAGVRVSTPAGLVRVDIGVPLGRRPSDKSWRIYVGLGQVF